MSIYNQPLESLSVFNTKMFNQSDDTISQAEADLLYLSKTKDDTSTATIVFIILEVSAGVFVWKEIV